MFSINVPAIYTHPLPHLFHIDQAERPNLLGVCTWHTVLSPTYKRMQGHTQFTSHVSKPCRLYYVITMRVSGFPVMEVHTMKTAPTLVCFILFLLPSSPLSSPLLQISCTFLACPDFVAIIQYGLAF